VSDDLLTPTTGPTRRLSVLTRGGLLVLCGVLNAAHGDLLSGYLWVAALAVAAAAVTLGPSGRRAGRAGRLAESAIAAVGIVATGGSTSPLFPYLLAPAFVGGLSDEVEAALAPAGVAIAVLAVGRIVADQRDQLSGYAATGAEWCLMAVALVLVAAWIQRLLQPPGAEPQNSYVTAYRLLAQLRTVARQLSVGLDTLTLADGLLTGIGAVARYDRAAVFVRSRGEHVLQLAHRGDRGEPLDWRPDLGGENPFADAWLSQQPQVVGSQLSAGRPGSALVLPLRLGLRTFGLVAVEIGASGAYPATLVRTIEPIVADASLRLSAAMLFDEIREFATVEERRRLAREIHDGIAQELASIGYFVDGLTAEARGTELEAHLRELRREVSRIISELRLSIFDLRSDVEQHGGLGAALSEYVRAVGASSPFTVHLSLDEGPVRLPADVEAELLRIAQEAITNARKHANARNLWVDCTVDPPHARLRVDDDGAGLSPGRDDSFGLEIMRERAARLRARLSIVGRQPTGTSVEVVLGVAPEIVTVGDEQRAAPTGR